MSLVALLSLVLVIAIIGFCVWLIVTYIPMPEPFKMGIIVIVVVVILLYVLRLLLGADLNLRLP